MKILAIGNSFSEDALYYLPAIARAEGWEGLVLGNLSIGGCTLKTHVQNTGALLGSMPGEGPGAYRYFKSEGGPWQDRPALLHEGLADEDWDIVSLQQASGSSGLPATYRPYLTELASFVKERTKPSCRLAWHMTWAYESGSSHKEFAAYHQSQAAMYRAIRSTFETEVLPTGLFSLLLPAGEAIQRSREALGDRLTRDGYHLNPLGRLIASYTWFAALTGRTPGENLFIPEEFSLSPQEEDALRQAVRASSSLLF